MRLCKLQLAHGSRICNDKVHGRVILNGDLAATMSKTGGLEPSLELTVFAKATTKV